MNLKQKSTVDAINISPLQPPSGQDAVPSDEMNARVPADQVQDVQSTPNTQMVRHTHSASHLVVQSIFILIPFPIPFPIQYGRILVLQSHSPLESSVRNRAATTALVSRASHTLVHPVTPS